MVKPLSHGADFENIKAKARGRWKEILPALAGLTAKQLKNFHQPCPLCGGQDRYRFDNKDGNGEYFCNQCGAGDGFDMVQKRNGYDKARAIKEVSNFVGGEAFTASTAKSPEPDAKEEVVPIMPVPDSAGEPDMRHYKLGNPVAVWPYRNAAGEVLFYIGRYNKPNGEKEHWPRTFCNLPGGKMGWKWKGAPTPRPLYGLDVLAANPKANVIVVEGEKKADAANRMLNPFNIVAISWCGGCKSRHVADWSPLAGRKCVVWPDADQDGKDAAFGVFNEERGVMQHGVAYLIAQAGGTARIVDLANLGKVEKGWDLADAEQEGWDGQRVIAYLKANLVDPETGEMPIAAPAPVDAPTPPPADEEEDEPHPADQPPMDDPETPTGAEVFNDVPDDQTMIRPLGYDGDEYFYYTAEKRQVTSLATSKHSELNLLGLAPESWWRMYFPTKGANSKFNWRGAANWLMRACYQKGVYDPDLIRGRGAWWDDGRTVLHLGDRLIVDGIDTNLHSLRSRFLYPASRRIRGPRGEPLSAAEASVVVETAKLIRWEMPASAALLAGWVALAPICGALRWRPHIWVTGGAGTGKTTVARDFVKPLLDGMAMFVQGDTSEAGIRQKLRSDAMPVLFDESEAHSQRDEARVQSVLGLMRVASTETGAVISKGSPQGNSQDFNIRSMFSLVSIGLAIKNQADQTRISVLGLKSVRPKTAEEQAVQEENWKELQAALAQFTTEFSERLLQRTFSMIPTIRLNAEILGRVAGNHFRSQRLGDQYGHLLAGAYSLFSDGEISEAKAREFIEKFDWKEYIDPADETDEMMCLSSILQVLVVVDGQNTKVQMSLGELIGYAASAFEETKNIGPRLAAEHLARYGLKVENNHFLIANRSDQLSRALAREKGMHAANWSNLLGRVDGAEKVGSTWFSAGIVQRAVKLPLRYAVKQVAERPAAPPPPPEDQDF